MGSGTSGSMLHLVSSGFRRQSCRHSASCPWARQKRMKARPFPRGVFNCRAHRGQSGVVLGQGNSASTERAWVVDEKGCHGT